jgi:DNA polymerase-3 subunit delta
MTHLDIINEFKSGKFRPVYFLTGTEPYFIDLITDYAEDNLLREGEKAFNQVVLYGKEISPIQITDEARQYPMMSAFRVVIVKEAQELKNLDGLTSYIEHPSPQTILIMAFKHKKLDKRLKIWKLINSQGVLYESTKMYDNKLPGWIMDYCKTQNMSIDINAANMVAEYLGNDLARITNEVTKLKHILHGKNTITSEIVKAELGISKEYDVFDLQKALGGRNWEAAHRIVYYMTKNMDTGDVIPITISLHGFFTKILLVKSTKDSSKESLSKLLGINPFFLPDFIDAARYYSVPHIHDIIVALKNADLHSKGIGRRNATASQILKDILISCMMQPA